MGAVQKVESIRFQCCVTHVLTSLVTYTSSRGVVLCSKAHQCVLDFLDKKKLLTVGIKLWNQRLQDKKKPNLTQF